MQVESLAIARRPSYDTEYPNQLVGLVSLSSSLGKQEVRLSTRALSRIFGIITEEVVATAKENASRVKVAMDEATHEPLLAAAATVKELP